MPHRPDSTERFVRHRAAEGASGLSESLTPLRLLTPAGGMERVGPTMESTVSIAVLRALVDAVAQLGGSRASFVDAAGLDRSQLDSTDARVSRAELYRLAALAIEHTGDPAFGLRWAESVEDRAFAPVSLLMAHATSLAQAFELLARFFPLLSEQSAYEIIEVDDSVVLHSPLPRGASAAVQRLCAELCLGGFLRFICSFHPNARPTRVCFGYEAPRYHEQYARLFHDRARFAQPFTGIVFDRALLDGPSPHRDDEVRLAMQSLAEQRLRRIATKTPHAIRVRELLVEHGRPRETDMKSVARAMSTSARSLRRRLTEEGQSYDQILNQALEQVAKQLLQDRRLSIQEVAFEMGFSDGSSFHRAFKRWTGMTPSAFRKSMLRAGPTD